MLRKRPVQRRFFAERLNTHSDLSWAVVGYPGGSIAEDADGEFLMRLSQQDAQRLAADMTRQEAPEPAGGHALLTMWPRDRTLPTTA